MASAMPVRGLKGRAFRRYPRSPMLFRALSRNPFTNNKILLAWPAERI